MRTQVKSISNGGRHGLKVETINPNTTFFALKKDLADPFRFTAAMKKVHARPSGPLFGQGRHLPQTKGQARLMWQEFLEGK